MLHVTAKEKESIDQMLKRYKNKVKAVGLIKEVRSRVEYKKPSKKRREELQKARYTESYRRKNEE